MLDNDKGNRNVKIVLNKHEYPILINTNDTDGANIMYILIINYSVLYFCV